MNTASVIKNVQIQLLLISYYRFWKTISIKILLCNETCKLNTMNEYKIRNYDIYFFSRIPSVL